MSTESSVPMQTETLMAVSVAQSLAMQTGGPIPPPMEPETASVPLHMEPFQMESSVGMQMETLAMATAGVAVLEASVPTQLGTVIHVVTAETALAGLPQTELSVEPVEAKPKTTKEMRKNLTDQERLAIVQFLLANSAGGRLKHGDMKAAATHFGVHRATIRRLWKLHLATSNAEGLAGNVASRIKGRSGRKPKVSDEEMKDRIAAIPPDRRMTGRGLSAALGVSNSVVLLIDLTNTLKYYNGEKEFEDSGVEYVKLKIEGFRGPPATKDVEKFMEIVDGFFAKESEGTIAVHCTHGLNRTGYLIVNYMVERQGLSVTEALAAFALARPPGLIKHMYVKELYKRLGPKEEMQMPVLPQWATDKYGSRKG
ncbi:hypothetical protein BBO99_00006842 [Phytophthora kernoviae]|uniref:Uncharacterized protein n=2 Tax=Phytophthora kernoviae TaxID=325452 RepID=A0A3R7MUV9_9STRA|nr:hypothetical protein G195_009231 [Phytophthora kernoviae 00238/432]KAG2529280.1 hypothetical protein JM16_001858 [Phytophthora kernoviae]KAG2530417.1 hypothetical protein JM18_002283 [Phytophthora kernoviae]RLN43658.1 hypothetical protein BBI17_006822 [Phytophthora kernoviae]RLN77325.1 hypothetical protein BBO99_00006842 [Phytophthora kernoviae]